MLLAEESLRRLVFSLLYTWGLGAEALPFAELMAELYPSSAEAKLHLAEAHVLLEEYQAAIEIYSAPQEELPDNPFVRSRLEWLRSR